MFYGKQWNITQIWKHKRNKKTFIGREIILYVRVLIPPLKIEVVLKPAMWVG